MSSSVKAGQLITGTVAQPVSTPMAPNFWVIRAPLSNNNPIFIGPVGVTLATGFPMEPGTEYEFDHRPAAGGGLDLTPDGLYVCGYGDIAAWLAFL